MQQIYNFNFFRLDFCPEECQGVCNNGTCQCKDNYEGQNCDKIINECITNCSDHGHCKNGECDCFDDYHGQYFYFFYFFISSLTKIGHCFGLCSIIT